MNTDAKPEAPKREIKALKPHLRVRYHRGFVRTWADEGFWKALFSCGRCGDPTGYIRSRWWMLAGLEVVWNEGSSPEWQERAYYNPQLRTIHIGEVTIRTDGEL